MASEISSPSLWPSPQAAYIHIPFCRHRCGYCNFSVLAGRDDLADRFLEALEWELSRLGQPQRVDTLFIGGGTPTHLPPAWLERLLQLLAHWLPLDAGAEFSVEANPGDIDLPRLEVLRGAGVNRISLGVQSFAADKLRVLQRDHDEQQARRAVEQCAEALGNVSIDLIFAAPEETLQAWQRDLAIAAELPITHLSTYALTYEKGTEFWTRRARGGLHQADEDLELQMYQCARQANAEAGLQQYEISNFARAGRQCRHNLGYWQGRPWYGFGPGAAGFLGGRRQTNHRSPTTYIRRCLAGLDPGQEGETITAEQWAYERAAFGVRMIQGVDLEEIRHDTGVDLRETRQQEIADCRRWGLVRLEGELLQLTEKGIAVADTVSAALL